MTYDWDPILKPYTDDHPELWPPTGAAIRLPPDFGVVAQVSPDRVLIWAGGEVVMVGRTRVDNAAMGEAGRESDDG